MKRLIALGSVVGLVVIAWACSSKSTSDAADAGVDAGTDASPSDAGTGGGGPNGGQLDPTAGGDPNSPWAPPTETGAVSFPYTPYKCGYSIRQVSPANPPSTFDDETALGSAPTPLNTHLTIPGDSAASVAVQWRTGADTLATELIFGDSPTALNKVAHGFSFSYASGVREHEVHLCGLLPSHTYYYVAGASLDALADAGATNTGDAGDGDASDDGGDASTNTSSDAGISTDAGASNLYTKVYSFTTAPNTATQVKVVVAGDSRSDPATWGIIAQQALGAGATALVLTGDAVDVGTDQAEWDALFAAAPDFFATMPTYWVHGNHEALAEIYFAQLALPDHGGDTGIEQWYASTYGPLRFIVLNDTVFSNQAIVTSTEANFLSGTLTNVVRAHTPWVVTSHHMPMITTSDTHGDNTETRGAWAPLYDQFHVNMNLTGHVHSYESSKAVTGSNANSEGTVTDDSHGTHHVMFGGAGAPLYGFGVTKPWLIYREPTHGYAILTATATTLSWAAFRQDGSAMDAFDVTP